jgi:Tetratricopeptide repeat
MIPRRLAWAFLLLLVGHAHAAAAGDPARARELVDQATQLTADGKYDEALQVLAQAQEADPTSEQVQSWLAHVYELKGDKARALTHVAALLALSPQSTYARDAARRLFATPPFPRLLTPATRALSPAKFAADVCTLGDDRMPGAPARVALSYTTSVRYPDDAPKGGATVERTLPVAGEAAALERFNRVVYGYVQTPDTGELRLRVTAYYPSELLSGSDRDLAPVAQALVHLMLRFVCYGEEVLGLPPQGDAEGIYRLWLCLAGPAGAQRSESDIFFYRVLEDERPPIEWLRQLAHECGHLLLPRVGGFAQPEMWGNGALGERLFLYLLAGEAARVAGTGWPSAEAAARADALWPTKPVALEDYLQTAAQAPLAVWMAGGPASELIVGQDERAMQYYVGFAMYILGAHGLPALRDVIRQCAGTTVADFVYTYKQSVIRWSQEGPLAIAPGCFDLRSTRLTEPPPAADLHPDTLTLTPGDKVTCPVFLPGADWQLAVEVTEATERKLVVSFDGGDEVEVAVGVGAKPVPIGPLAENWHSLAVRLAADQPALRVSRWAFRRG